MRHSPATHIVPVVLFALAVAGCGGGGGGSGGGGSGGGARPPVTVSPAAPSVFTSDSVTLVASGGTPPYTYVLMAGAGTITAAGVYTAPTSAGSATVRVSDSGGLSATVTITVNGRVAMNIFPETITMPASTGQSYSFTGLNGAGGYQFQLLSGPGSITTNGVYTAGDAAGTATIRVTDQQGATATATVRSVFVRANGPVYTVASDGTHWYLGGAFTAVNAYQTPHFVALDTSNGAPNLACDVQDGFDGDVLTTVTDGTALYVGGRFAHYRGTETPGGLVKIDPVTCRVIRTYFLATDQAEYTSSLFLSGNSLLVNARARFYRGSGAATSLAFTMMRIDATSGNRDPSFIVTTPVGELPRIFATANAVYAGHLKLDPVTGALDGNFLLPFPSTIYSYAASGSSLYLAGTFGNGFAVRRVSAANGGIEAEFTLTGYVYDLALVGNSLYVAGSFDDAVSQLSGAAVAKLDATTGVVDTAFAPPLSIPLEADGGGHALLHDNGALYLAGNFSSRGGTPSKGIARLDGATGAIDASFTRPVGLSHAGLSLSKLGNTLFVGGKFVAYGGTPSASLAKLNIATGVADAAFLGTDLDGRVSALAYHAGHIYLGGEFHNYNGSPAEYLAKINANTAALDTNFTHTGTSHPVENLAVNDSGVFISGNYFSYGGTNQRGFTKLRLSDGALDPGFVNGFEIGPAGPIALHGQHVYTSSPFAEYDFVVNPQVYRINAQTGAADPDFTGLPASTQERINITFLGDSGYASFTRFVNGVGDPASMIVKFDGGTGLPDTNFVASYDQVFTPITALRGVGASLYVAATPVRFAGENYGFFLGKLDATTGAMDTTFAQPSVTTNGRIHTLETTGTDLWVAGAFSRYRGSLAYYFVQIDPATGAISGP